MDYTNHSPLVLKKRRTSPEMSLQITSMADIFTIILVFLLKSYAANNTNVTPSPKLRLPAAHTEALPKESTRIEISEDAVLVDDEPVATLKHFEFAPQAVQANGAAAAVEEALKLRKKRQVEIAKANADVKEDRNVLIVSDRDTPYGTLKAVLAAAGYQGFSDYQLVVIKKD